MTVRAHAEFPSLVNCDTGELQLKISEYWSSLVQKSTEGPVLLFQMVPTKDMDWRDGSEGKDAADKADDLSLMPWNPHGGRREPTSTTCPRNTSVFCHVNIHTYTCSHTQNT